MTTELSGVDLARVALANARKAAKAAPPQKKPRRGAARDTRTGRDPMVFGAAIQRMMADRGWETGVSGGTILGQWATIAPELAGKVAAEAFDEDTGTLSLRPATHAYATQLRLHERQVVQRIRTAPGCQAVQAIRILPVGAATAPSPQPAAPPPAPAERAVPRTPAPPGEKSAGYRRALEAHRSVYRPYDDPAGAQAVERQLAALRTNRLPDEEHSEYRYLLEQEAEQQQRENDTNASLRAALRYKHTGQTTSTTTDQRPATGVA